jgi:hypothetical protein
MFAVMPGRWVTLIAAGHKPRLTYGTPQARSARVCVGGGFWRRRTASSWRRTRISMSLEVSDRARSASQPSTRSIIR